MLAMSKDRLARLCPETILQFSRRAERLAAWVSQQALRADGLALSLRHGETQFH
jgi:hypothetical protein